MKVHPVPMSGVVANRNIGDLDRDAPLAPDCLARFAPATS